MPVKVDEPHHLDDIVISGLSGMFPSSENIEEFKKNLFDGRDMTSLVKSYDRSEAVRSMGLMKNVDYFDNNFFGMDRKQAACLPPYTRLLLERIFEAIMDAGYNVDQMKGKKIAVVCGIFEGFMDENRVQNNEDDKASCKRLQHEPANMISHLFDFHGPSITLYSACSSSSYAMDYAMKAFQNEDCDGAIVCSVNFGALPGDNLFKMGVLSSTGVCRPFDADGDGYVKAEAAVAVFMQKTKDARRIYANIIHSKTNCDGFKAEGITCPSIKMQKDLYANFYTEINVDPSQISFLEAHGTATKVGDLAEGTSIEFFCRNRETPLKLGSVKSNMGHAEGAAGLCSLVKMIISFEEGMIPPNLNYNRPNPNIKGLQDGKLQVTTKSMPVEGKYFALNSFGLGGANSHILISPHNKIKKKENESTNKRLPCLVTVSARTEEGINFTLDQLEKNHTDFEYIRLMHEIFSENIDGYFHRGYIILNRDNHLKSKKIYCNEKRSLWFIFSGMGSQWPGMGASLMKIPIFAESIDRSNKVLQSKGVDLIKIITSNDSQIIKNLMNSCLGIVAIQVALVDVLKAIGIEPDGMLGHSFGEIACAYADGCLTAEQTIMIAYYYGLVSSEAEFMQSTMAVVGLNYNILLKNQVPQEIYITSHDSASYCTISGPTEVMIEFIETLDKKNIPVHKIHTSNIAYHTRYITSAAFKLTSYLKKINTFKVIPTKTTDDEEVSGIFESCRCLGGVKTKSMPSSGYLTEVMNKVKIMPEPKLRSEKWLCTSALENLGPTHELKYCSSHYFTNNFLSPVYFEETFNHIPTNAIAIEIAPHSHLIDILKLSPVSSVQFIPLTIKNDKNGIEFFLNAVGQLYEVGFNLKLSNLYPPIEFPVSKSTPMISPFIKWQHTEEFLMRKMVKQNSVSTVRDVVINPKSNNYQYILGHVIDERNLYPGLGYLELIWDTVASMLKKETNTVSIVFENIHFERATNVPKKGVIKFRVTIHLGTNKFEITENGAPVVSGEVRVPKNINIEEFEIEPFEDKIANDNNLILNAKDFYKELRLKGYHYKALFKKVVYANSDGTYGKVSWNNNFTTFMDTAAQITALYADCRQLMVPTFIRKLVINVNKHYKILQTLNEGKPELPVNFYPELGLLSSGGVQMLGFRTNEIARRPEKADPVLETHEFTPYISDTEMNLSLAIRICVHIALENIPSIKVKTYELLDQEYNKDVASISNHIAKSLADLPLIQASIKVLSQSKNGNENECPQGIEISDEDLPADNSTLLIVLSNIQSKKDKLEDVFKALIPDGFIITKESQCEQISFEDLGFHTCFSRAINDDEKIVLIRKIKERNSFSCSKAIKIENDSFSWITEIQNTLADIKPEENENFVVYAEKEELSGILGFFNCLRREEKGIAARCFFIQDRAAPNFSLEDLHYKPQLDKNLSQNIFKHGQWGSYRHLPLKPTKEIETISAFCSLEKRADLSSFKWFEDSVDPTECKTQNEKHLIYVHYSSLNFRDVLLAVGRVSQSDYAAGYSRFNEGYQGIEYSGKDINGRRLMGIVNTKGLSTIIEALPMSTWLVPDNMTLEEAASIPIIYSTVIYSLLFRMELKKGSSILIHAGAGGIGQAAINICLHYECNIFTTVGTSEKIDFIRKTYPQIPENHICNSRDTSFEKVILEETNGNGVDVVLNSLSEEKLKASLRCCAKGGHFVEIGKFDMTRNNHIGMSVFINDITFHSIQLDVTLNSKDLFLSLGIHEKIQKLLHEGVIKPIQRTVFETDAVESAFRYMAAGKHIGKVIIKIKDEVGHLNSKPILTQMKAEPRVVCHEDESNVIIGGLGGFGMELADWLILRGARKIVLSSRTGVKNGYQSYRIKLWRSYGVNVVISTDDVTKEHGVEDLLQTANSLGPVAGIFNVALILKDDPFQKQTSESFNIVGGPKAIATIHLDKLSKKLCPHLKHFVVFSSVVCGRGNLNQTNYGFSNSIMERICESRNSDNLPALAIQWGAIGEVGVVAEFAEDNLSFAIGGTLQQNVRSCLNSLNFFMKQPKPIVSSMIVAEKRYADSDIINTIANIIGIKNLKAISLTWTLPELGMDSILGVEIKQVLESEFNMFFSSKDLLTMTFEKLYKLKEEKHRTIPSEEQMKPQYLQLSMDVKLIKEPIVRIPLNTSRVKQISVHNNTKLFILPGIEGVALFMETLAENLPIEVFCFQYYNDEMPFHSISKLGEYFVQFILEKLESGQEFCILGHSLGGLYSLEIVRILEQKGRKGYLWLVDSSPAYIAVRFAHFCGRNQFSANDELVQNNICTQMLKMALPEMNVENYFSYLEKANSWESKKNIVFSITSQFSIVKELMNIMLDKIYSLSKVIPGYKFHSSTLETQCILIRLKDNPYDMDESYGLTEYFKNPVQIHAIEANHFTIVNHPKTTNIIMDCPIWRRNMNRYL